MIHPKPFVRFRRLVASVAVAWLATVTWLAAVAAPAAEFPSELVEFEPAQTAPIFGGRGNDYWDAKIRERGWIVRDAQGFHLWYTGYTGDKQAVKQLGYATSTDGLEWTRYARNPLDPVQWIEDMMVVRDGDTYYMVAEGRGDQAQLFSSKDRVSWTHLGQLDVRTTNGKPIEPGPYGTPVLWREPSKWWLFYERRDAGVWAATSPDLKTWTNVSDDPVLARGPTAYDRFAVAMNQVVKYRGRYYAYYHGADTPEWRRWSTSVAVSDDLIHWEKYARNPLVENNESSGIVVDDGTRFRLYTMHDQVRVRFSRVIPQTRLGE